jgi:hypothetical protein
MKRIFLAGALAAAALCSTAQAHVSVSIGQPGFYGRIDIGGYPTPALLYPQPVIIQGSPYGAQPLYLRVPPGHAKNWRKHCYRYDACGHPVYFVRDDWYEREYVPQYRSRYQNEGERHNRYEGREERRDERRDDRYDDRRNDNERGRGREHGHGRHGD